MTDKKTNLGIQYINDTSFSRNTIRSLSRHEIIEVSPFKRYPQADKIELPRKWDLEEARIIPLLQNRRSLRKYSDESLSVSELSFMLWASQGITAQAGKYLFRTAPSGGALYPIETYLSIHRVEGIDPGLYHFDPELFMLERLTKLSVGEQVASACLNQRFIASSAVTFIWTSIFHRNLNKYRDRGLRYILLDAGHICQNLLIGAEAVGCGGCPIAAFFDDELNSILDIDTEREAALYLASVGKKST